MKKNIFSRFYAKRCDKIWLILLLVSVLMWIINLSDGDLSYQLVWHRDIWSVLPSTLVAKRKHFFLSILFLHIHRERDNNWKWSFNSLQKPYRISRLRITEWFFFLSQIVSHKNMTNPFLLIGTESSTFPFIEIQLHF